MPFVLRPRNVERVRNVAYGPAGRFNLLDVYHHRSRPGDAPVPVYFHWRGFPQLPQERRRGGRCCSAWRARAG